MNICQNLYWPVKAAILSTDETGLIRIGHGTAWEIEALMQKLMELETMGLLSRPEGTAFYRPFQLTRQGQMLKEALSKMERETVDPIAA